MKITKLTSFFLIVATMSGIVFAGCGTGAPVPTPPSTSAPLPVVNREKAIALATADCRKGHLVLKGDPVSVDASMTTLKEADAAVRSADQIHSYDVPMSVPVWLVTITGTFEFLGGPTGLLNPGATPMPPQNGVCKAIEEAGREKSQGVYTLLQTQ